LKKSKIESKSFKTLVNSLDAEIEEKKRYDYIKKFAVAQSLIGVDKTLEWKRKILGSKPLEESSLEGLEALIKKLRGVYRWQREKQQENS
tara:strand:+ start:266 stop:535 length:270 start_codon:yes stop_codon:yes gene_type:complete